VTTQADTSADARPTESRSLSDLYADARAEIAAVDGLDRFARMVEQLRAHADDFRVAIAARRDDSTLAHVRTLPYSGFDEDLLARQCGPGRYRLTLKDAANRIVTNCELSIAAGLGAPPQSAPSFTPPEPDRLARLESLVENLIERRPSGAAPGLGEIAQLIQACRPASEGLSIKDLLQTVTTIVPLIAGRASPVKDIIEGMRAVRDLSGDGAESDSASLVQSILGALASMAQQQRPTMRATPAEPAPPAPRRVPQSPPAPTAPPAPGTAAAPTPTPTPPPAPRPAETGLVSMLAAPVGKAIVFGAMSGIAPENLAPAVIDLIDASADAGTVPADQAGLCEWLVGQLPPDASDMVPILTAYIGELAEAISVELESVEPDEQLQDDIDENGRPRSGDPMYAPLTTEDA